ncbi:MAG: hypothetical protein ACK55I_07465, partial [bacterium]
MSDHEAAYKRMAVTIVSLMTVGQWWNVFLDICVPALHNRALLYTMRTNLARMNRKIYKVRAHIDEQVAASKNTTTNSKDVSFSARKLKVDDDIEKGTHATQSATRSSPSHNENIQHELKFDEDESLKKLQKRMNFMDHARSKCWEEALQSRYDSFSDYTSLIIQVGFIL